MLIDGVLLITYGNLGLGKQPAYTAARYVAPPCIHLTIYIYIYIYIGAWHAPLVVDHLNDRSGSRCRLITAIIRLPRVVRVTSCTIRTGRSNAVARRIELRRSHRRPVCPVGVWPGARIHGFDRLHGLAELFTDGPRTFTVALANTQRRA